MDTKVILLEEYCERKKAAAPLYDEAEARAAEQALEEFDRVDACLDEEKMEEYLLGTLDIKYIV